MDKKNLRLILASIIIFNLFIGFLNINNVELRHSDEGHFFSEAAILNNDNFKSKIDILDANKPLFIGVIAVLMHLFGFSIHIVLVMNIIIGIGSVLLIYLLGKKLFDERVGIFAAILLSLSKLHISFVKSALSDTMLNFFLILSLLIYVMAIQGSLGKGKQGRRNTNKRAFASIKRTYLLFFLTGAAAACAFLTKPLGGMVIVLIGGLEIVSIFLYKKKIKQVFLELLAISLGLLSVEILFIVIYWMLGYDLLYRHLFLFTIALRRYQIGAWVVSLLPFLSQFPEYSRSTYIGNTSSLRDQLMYIYYFFVGFSYTIIIAFFAGAYDVIRNVRKKSESIFLVCSFLIIAFLLFLLGFGVPRVLFIITPIIILFAANSINVVDKIYGKLKARFSSGALIKRTQILKSKNSFIKFIFVLFLILTLVDIKPVVFYSPDCEPVYQYLRENEVEKTISNAANIVSFYLHSDSINPESWEEFNQLIDEGYTTYVYYSWFDYAVVDERIEKALEDENPVYYHEYEVEDWRVADELYGFVVWADSTIDLEIFDFFLNSIGTTSTTQYIKVYQLDESTADNIN
jgi:4-amino-4-deoxy-L-arabinose transferase-like glycosyltransferase